MAPHDARGFFAIGVYHAKKEANIGTLLRSAHNFGAAFVFTVGRRYDRQASDTTKAWRHMPLFHFESIEDMMAHVPYDTQVVGVEQDPRAILLPAFHHPERAVYLLGAEDYGLPPAALEAAHRLVEVPESARCLNVSVAGSIVIYDRIAKSHEWPSIPPSVAEEAASA